MYTYNVSWLQELLALAAVAKVGLAMLQFFSESWRSQLLKPQ